MNTVVGAGGVVLVRQPFAGVVLVVHRHPPEIRLPKGLVEEGESLQDAALREVLEETGMSGTIESQIGMASWQYRFEGTLTAKEVTYFLISHPVWARPQGDPDVLGLIHADVRVALDLMTFEGERHIVERALTLRSGGV
jgi:8-oxo-dGTP pyrophosphatase MutT (NUDIX family)